MDSEGVNAVLSTTPILMTTESFWAEVTVIVLGMINHVSFASAVMVATSDLLAPICLRKFGFVEDASTVEPVLIFLSHILSLFILFVLDITSILSSLWWKFVVIILFLPVIVDLLGAPVVRRMGQYLNVLEEHGKMLAVLILMNLGLFHVTLIVVDIITDTIVLETILWLASCIPLVFFGYLVHLISQYFRSLINYATVLSYVLHYLEGVMQDYRLGSLVLVGLCSVSLRYIFMNLLRGIFWDTFELTYSVLEDPLIFLYSTRELAAMIAVGVPLDGAFTLARSIITETTYDSRHSTNVEAAEASYEVEDYMQQLGQFLLEYSTENNYSKIPYSERNDSESVQAEASYEVEDYIQQLRDYVLEPIENIYSEIPSFDRNDSESVPTEASYEVSDYIQQLRDYVLESRENINSEIPYSERIDAESVEAESYRGEPYAAREVEEDNQHITQETTRDVSYSRKIFLSGVGMMPYLQKLLNCLSKDGNDIIGIWGENSTDNSALLRAVNIYHGETSLFDHVLFVDASGEHSMERLQMAIAENLQSQVPSQLGYPESDSDKKEYVLSFLLNSFLQNKDILFLIDNLPKTFNLEQIGLSHPVQSFAFSGWHKHKVVFTTRSYKVCIEMEAEPLRLERLQIEEAWQLFKENAGEETISADPRIEKIARQVAKECGGLPLALAIAGHAMYGEKDHNEWQHALQSLEESHDADILNLEGYIFPPLKFVYNRLQDDILQECFFSCLLWHEGSKEDVISCWVGLDLIKPSNGMAEAYDQGHSLLKSLEHFGLLESSPDECYVKVQEIILELAESQLAVECKERTWIIRPGTLWKEPTVPIDRWKSAEIVSLLDSGVRELPQELYACEKVIVLILSRSYIQGVPTEFFQCVSASLTYLDLSNTILREVPTGIGVLTKLKYLNLSSTSIRSLPRELSKLKILEYLLLRETDIGTISHYLISSLSSLKLLDAFPHATIDLESVELLRSIKVMGAMGLGCFDTETLSKVGLLPIRWLRIRYLKYLNSSLEKHLITSLGLHNLSANNGNFIQELEVSSCSCLEELVVDVLTSKTDDDFKEQVVEGGRTSEATELPPLGRLEILQLTFLESLKSVIWKRLEPEQCLRNLKVLIISYCPMLKNVTWVLRLPSLTTLSLIHCHGMQRVIGEEENEFLQGEATERQAFASLRVLDLIALPELSSICDHRLSFRSLTSVCIVDCEKLDSLPLHPNMINRNGSLEIKCPASWWEGLKWENKSSFQSYFREHL